VTTPPFVPGGVRVFHGNRWQTAAGSQHLSAPITAATPPPFEDIHPVQQVVIAGPPALPAGRYIVEVVCNALGGGAFQQFPGQPFALVFVGSGPEIRTAAPPGAGPVAGNLLRRRPARTCARRNVRHAIGRSRLGGMPCSFRILAIVARATR
jgi:hypothetical protein